MARRRAVSAPYREFSEEICRLKRLDTENQNRLALSVGNPGQGRISKRQLDLLSEGVFLATFRSFENMIEDIFLLYVLEKSTISGKKPSSYLRPKNFDHCRSIIKSSQPYIDWSDPDQIVKRAELFLKSGEPVKSHVAANLSFLREVKWVRNHVAHGSTESRKKYQKVLQDRLLAVPLRIPTVGEFLNMPIRTDRHTYHLRQYMERISQIAHDLCH